MITEGQEAQSRMAELTIDSYMEQLSSRAPVPGGGGTSALGAALGMGLGTMVGSLTVGKKRYQQVEAEICTCMDQSRILQKQLLQLMDEDAEAFRPLAEAFRMPHSTEEEQRLRAAVMEEALAKAALVPLTLAEKTLEVLQLLEVYAEKGSSLAISDAGVAAAFLRSALQGASLNVKINTAMMKDRELAKAYEARLEDCLTKGIPQADAIYELVLQRLSR